MHTLIRVYIQPPLPQDKPYTMLRQTGSQNPPLSQEESTLLCASSGAPQRLRMVLSPGLGCGGEGRAGSLAQVEFSHTNPWRQCVWSRDPEGVRAHMGSCGGGWRIEALRKLRMSLEAYGFVLTVVIFQMVFNHIVITKHQDHFLPSVSLYRVLGCDCAKLFVQTLLCGTCSLRRTSTHAEAQGLPGLCKSCG